MAATSDNPFLRISFSAVSEPALTIMIAIYSGLVLNLPVFWRKFHVLDELVFSLLVSDVFSAVLVAVVVIHGFSLLGVRVYKGFAVFYLLMSAIAAYYMWQFNVVIGYGIVQAVFGTEFNLSLESVGPALLVFVFFFGMVPAWLVFRAKVKCYKNSLQALFYRLGILVLVFVGLKCISYSYERVRHQLVGGREQTNPIGVAAHSYIPSNWISASIMAVGNYLINESLREKWRDPAKAFTLNATEDLQGVYLVFVIGESARYNNFGLLGYQRNTTPLLEKQKNVLGFKASSCNTVTKASLACMFVRSGGVRYDQETSQQYVYEMNVFQVLKELGFTIDLFAMQSEAGFYTTVAADMFKIREEIGAEASHYGNPVIDDMLLVNQALASITEHPQGKHVVILHQKGSHFLYSSRYPRAFSHFQPECESMHCSKQALINAYDNSILYTDYFLSSLIDRLKGKKVLLIYASDHGESIEEDQHFHGSPKFMAPAEQSQIPVIVWASDALLQDPAAQQHFAAIQQRHDAAEKLRHDQLFESILGCLGYQSPDGGIRAENNWCAEEKQRLVTH